MIDFKEIPIANTGSGEQDYFELFARDFFLQLGFTIEEDPARGADNGRDLIISEIHERKIDGHKTTERWLISCKHYSKSGKSITARDELDVYDRLKSNNCVGFIGFYSTIANESLIRKLNNVRFVIYDHKKIEALITSEPSLIEIFKRYFPKSFNKFQQVNEPFIPTKLFESFFESNQKMNKIASGSILFSKIFKSEQLYNGFLLYDNMIEFFQSFGYKFKIISYVEDRFKVAESLLYAWSNEFINDDDVKYEIIDNQYIINETDSNGNNIRTVIPFGDEETKNQIEAIYFMKDSPASIAKRLKEVIKDHETFPKEITVKMFGAKTQEYIYFISENQTIYLDQFTFDYSNAVFNIVKTNFFR